MKVFTPSASPQPLDEYVYANPRDLTCVISIRHQRKVGNKISTLRILDCSNYYIKSAKIESTGVQGKIFGTTYCQKLSCTLLIGTNKTVSPQKGSLVELWFYPTEKNIDLTIINKGCPGLKNNENYMINAKALYPNINYLLNN